MDMTTIQFIITILLVNGIETLCKQRHAFYKDLNKDNYHTRRVFGGELANLSEFPNVVALLDSYWAIRCSGAAITTFWVLTAGHCVTSQIAYVKYNSQRPASSDGDTTAVLYLYKHPEYKVVQEDEGRGMDVTLLHNDVGLIRTRDKMKMTKPLKSIFTIGTYFPKELYDKDLSILGFGKTQISTHTRVAGEELFSVKLKIVDCDRSSWIHCICGVATGTRTTGVCEGDSGGPVIYNGVQVGITSMGPVECSSLRSGPELGATSVFTSTYHYVEHINSTITDTELHIKKKHTLRTANEPNNHLFIFSMAVNLRISLLLIVYSIVGTQAYVFVVFI